jgi:hypothetical protein
VVTVFPFARDSTGIYIAFWSKSTVQRHLANHELKLLEFLLSANESFYEYYVPRWRAQVETCTVHEVNVPYCLAISHEDRLPGGGYTQLARILVGS